MYQVYSFLEFHGHILTSHPVLWLKVTDMFLVTVTMHEHAVEMTRTPNIKLVSVRALTAASVDYSNSVLSIKLMQGW